MPVFVVLKMFYCVGNIVESDSMACVGPSVDDLLATFWQRAFCCFFKMGKQQDFFINMFGFSRHSRSDIYEKSTTNEKIWVPKRPSNAMLLVIDC